MLGKDDNDAPLPPIQSDRKIFSRSVSWAGSSPTKPAPGNSKSLWNSKGRACLPPLKPLSVSRSRTEEWPRAGSDDLGEWPNVGTPGARSKPLEFEFKKDKLAFFDKECSRIIDHVFLGSDAVARNRDVLRENGITHVLNCVGFVCPEYFKNDFVYKTLWLRDSPSEDITSILYDVFDYFEDVQDRKGRVFVHCCQGVSRSTSLVIAYLMWREGKSFEDAFQQVKAARGVTNPNMGFASQLLQCQKRVHAVPVSPSSVLRVYRMAPHSSYAPLHLVPKLLADLARPGLDSRGAFIINVPSGVYVWTGKNCDRLMSESARLAASQVIRYEKANGPVMIVNEGEESIEFWNALGDDRERFVASGERKIAEYDLDFGFFEKAVNGGVVPPLSISGTGTGNNSEMRLPARQSGWERLRQKFATGIIKELIESPSNEVECDSPDSCSSFSALSSTNSFSSFLVNDPRKFDSGSPSLSPSTSDYSNSFTFSPTSSNWSDLSASAQPSPSGFEPSGPSPNPCESPKNLVRTWSFSMEDRSMEDVEDYSLTEESTEASFVLYRWPSMERVETGSSGIPDSRAVYISYVTNLSSGKGNGNPCVLYIWVGRDVSDTNGDDKVWQTVGCEFLVRKGLATGSIVEVVKEGEEPEKLWKHLHCFSFQNNSRERSETDELMQRQDGSNNTSKRD